MSSSYGTVGSVGQTINPDGSVTPPTADQMTPAQRAAFAGSFQPGYFGAPTNQGQDIAPPPPPPAPAPPQTADFMTPAMQKYVDQFKMSQAQQQQAINAGLMQAMQGLGQRRDAAANTVATLPGAVNDTYARTQADAARQAAQENAQVGANVDAGARALIASNAAGEKGAALGMTPLLQAGVTADYSKGATTLSNTKMMNEAALQQQQQDFDTKLLMAQAQWQQGQQDKSAAYQHDIDMANLQSSLSQQAFDHEHPGGALDPLQQQREEQAIKAGYRNYAAQQAATQGDFYNAVVEAFRTGNKVPLPGSNGVTIHGGNRGDLARQVYSSNQDVFRALVQQGIITPDDLKKAGLGGGQ
jgi:hypothetical protein